MKQAAREIAWMLLVCGAVIVVIRQISLTPAPIFEQAMEGVRNCVFLAAGYVVARAVSVFTGHAPNQPPTQ